MSVISFPAPSLNAPNNMSTSSSSAPSQQNAAVEWSGTPPPPRSPQCTYRVFHGDSNQSLLNSSGSSGGSSPVANGSFAEHDATSSGASTLDTPATMTAGEESSLLNSGVRSTPVVRDGCGGVDHSRSSYTSRSSEWEGVRSNSSSSGGGPSFSRDESGSFASSRPSEDLHDVRTKSLVIPKRPNRSVARVLKNETRRGVLPGAGAGSKHHVARSYSSSSGGVEDRGRSEETNRIAGDVLLLTPPSWSSCPNATNGRSSLAESDEGRSSEEVGGSTPLERTVEEAHDSQTVVHTSSVRTVVVEPPDSVLARVESNPEAYDEIDLTEDGDGPRTSLSESEDSSSAENSSSSGSLSQKLARAGALPTSLSLQTTIGTRSRGPTSTAATSEASSPLDSSTHSRSVSSSSKMNDFVRPPSFLVAEDGGFGSDAELRGPSAPAVQAGTGPPDGLLPRSREPINHDRGSAIKGPPTSISSSAGDSVHLLPSPFRNLSRKTCTSIQSAKVPLLSRSSEQAEEEDHLFTSESAIKNLVTPASGPRGVSFKNDGDHSRYQDRVAIRSAACPIGAYDPPTSSTGNNPRVGLSWASFSKATPSSWLCSLRLRFWWFVSIHLLDVATNLGVMCILIAYRSDEEDHMEISVLVGMLLSAFLLNGCLLAYVSVRSDPWIASHKNPFALIGGILLLGFLQGIHVRLAWQRYVQLRDLLLRQERANADSDRGTLQQEGGKEVDVGGGSPRPRSDAAEVNTGGNDGTRFSQSVHVVHDDAIFEHSWRGGGALERTTSTGGSSRSSAPLQDDPVDRAVVGGDGVESSRAAPGGDPAGSPGPRPVGTSATSGGGGAPPPPTSPVSPAPPGGADCEVSMLYTSRKYSSKSVEGLFEGLVFSAVQLYILCRIRWCRNMGLELLWEHELLLLVSLILSLFTCGTAVMEIDYRISTFAQQRIDRSARYALLHTCYRVSEIVLRVQTTVLFLVFLRSSTLRWWYWLGIAMPLVDYCIIFWMLHRVSPAEEDHKYFGLKLLVSLPLVITNVAKFVDRPNFVGAARYVTCFLEPLYAPIVLLVIHLFITGISM